MERLDYRGLVFVFRRGDMMSAKNAGTASAILRNKDRQDRQRHLGYAAPSPAGRFTIITTLQTHSHTILSVESLYCSLHRLSGSLQQATSSQPLQPPGRQQEPTYLRFIMANPLDTDAGSELFSSYESELKLVQADLNQKLDQITELSGEPRKSAVRLAERSLEEANELVCHSKAPTCYITMLQNFQY
jgi:hypothetical protein